ncbi:MAG: DNA-directed RNA polymerase subunit beta [Candidatus Peregrinibacteria bacterium GW2011_GWA2_47_7]|nr:MAG: DNA-directed RNA polymerase subunit beta [Candidatus Peregrinibacteria bacterium GW2011_GWA2_47_7]
MLKKKLSAAKPAPKAKAVSSGKEGLKVRTIQSLKTIKPLKTKKTRINTYLPESMPSPVLGRTNRKFLSPQHEVCPLPPLVEIQIDSYKWFLRDGIRELLDEISPITDFSGKKMELHFLEHSIGEPKYDPLTAKNKNLTYEAPLKVHVQLINKETGEIKEQDVFLGAVPLMTIHGTFIINGIERVVVSQIVRSPGVFFSRNTSAPPYCNAKIWVFLVMKTTKTFSIFLRM